MRRAVLALLLLTACHRAEKPAAFPGAPVVLISIDTLRSDHLPAYGYKSVQTPSLDALRRDAILYRSAWSHCPMTLPSHVSILTGLLPPEHGVRDNVGFRFDGTKHASLPQILKQHGYATGAAVSSVVLRGEAGLAPLFDTYDDAIEARPGALFREYQRSGFVTESVAERWIDAHAAQPFFYFFHIYEPHVPYDPPEPFRSRYANRYDGEIAAADAIVGKLLDHLKIGGLYDRALIVVLSDHGEGLGDHGEDQHSILVYREALQVPLIVKLPKSTRKGSTVEEATPLTAVFSTILNAVGVGQAPPPVRPIYSESLYPLYHFGWSDLRSLTDGRFHFIASSSRAELFNLQTDAAEQHDVSASERRTLTSMRDELAKYGNAIPQLGEVDPETARQLAALGYVGSARNRQAGPRPDPRDAIGSLAALRQAIALGAAGRTDEAVAAFHALLAKSPDMVEAWTQLGDTLTHAARPAEAAEAYRQAIAHSSGFSPDLSLSLADVLLQSGKPVDAAQLASASLAAAPRRAHELLARAALALHDYRTAEQHARVLADAPDAHATDILLLAEIADARGDFIGALDLAQQASRRAAELEIPGVYRLELVRGDALARLGRPGEAIDAYRREIAAFPNDTKAYANLAVLYFVTGNRAAVEPALRALVAANPTPAARELAKRTRETLR
jgi:choline-sulfatase